MLVKPGVTVRQPVAGWRWHVVSLYPASMWLRRALSVSCGAVCTDDVGCGSGYSCIAIPGLEASVIPKMCVPNDVSCG